MNDTPKPRDALELLTLALDDCRECTAGHGQSVFRSPTYVNREWKEYGYYCDWRQAHDDYDGKPRVVYTDTCADRPITGGSSLPDEAEARAAAEAHRAAVVADSPELAAAVRERDGLSAMVEDLEVERAAADAQVSALVRDVARLVEERDVALARVRELEAAAQPKHRDDSGPAPGWTVCDEAREKYIRDGGLTDKSGTWLAYDEEHGYAPPDESAIRSDERALTECDIAAWCFRAIEDGTDLEWVTEVIQRSDYPHTDAPASADVLDGKYPCT